MIRHIVAIDERRGMAKDHAMPPWKLKGDEAYFTEHTKLYGGHALMGKGTFVEALKRKPLTDRVNYVVTSSYSSVEGAIVVNDLQKFIEDWPSNKDLWVIGGAEIFAQTLKYADELYITEIKGDFDCDRFYPEYKSQFKLKSRSSLHSEHGVEYSYCVYVPVT